MPLNKCDSNNAYIFPTEPLLWSKYRLHIAAYICPSNATCKPHIPISSLHTDPTILHIYAWRNNKLKLLNYHAIAKYVQTTKMPLKCYIYATDANEFMCIYETTTSQYMPHTNSLLSKVTSCTALHIKHYWHMPWTNMPTKLHIYVPLYCYSSLHIHST